MRTLAAAALLLAFARGAAAQAVPAAATPWPALEDSLQALASAGALPAQPRPVRDAPAASWLRSGLIELRRFELTRREPAFDFARAAFEQAERRDPREPWAAYGLGRALLQSPELHPGPHDIIAFSAFRDALGRGPRSRAEAALRRALALDPAFARAATSLAGSALETGDAGALRQAAAALARVDSAGGADLPALVARSRVQAALGELPGAESAARCALALDPRSAAAHLALADVLLRQEGRDSAGSRAYFEGLATADSAGAEPYLRDLAVYQGKQGLDSLRALAPAAREQALRRFWEERAALSALTVPERLALHYRRLAVARERYRRRGRIAVMVPDFARLRLPSADEEFDDRGAIYVRWGKPDATATSPMEEPRNESWYYRAVGDVPVAAFDFIQDSHTPDFYLSRRLLCNTEMLADRASLDPSIAQALLACRSGDYMAQQQYSAAYLAWVRAAERKESAGPVFTGELPFWYDLESLSAAPGKSRVVAAIGVPVARLHAQRLPHSLHYTVRAQLVLTDTVRGTTERAEITRVYESTRPLAPDQVLRFTLELDAPPSPAAVYRVRLEDPATGAGRVYGGPHAIPDFAPPRLAMSDILLAAPAGGVNWIRDSVQLSLTPAAEFPGGVLASYYELYNLPPGTAYQTEIEVVPAQKGILGTLDQLVRGGRAVRVRFESQATSSPTVPELRRIDTALPPGHYRMRVRVLVPGAQPLENAREFTVR